MKWVEASIHVILANLVPLWGFTQQDWSAGTTLALYWFQTLVGVPIIAVLILFHRRATRKAGHYSGTMTIRDSRGSTSTRASTFLQGFLLMSIPFTLAHGVFLAVLLGMIWKNAEGAVSFEDVRIGAVATLNVMALGFAFDLAGLRQKSFAWIELRAGTVLQRTLVVHLAIIFGMGFAALTGKDAAAFFAVFLALKILMDVLSEMPPWDPKEPPAWMTRLMNRLGPRDGKTEDFETHWKKEREERLLKAALAEEPVRN